MPEFLTLRLPDEARRLLFANITWPLDRAEELDVPSAQERVCFEDILAPHALPEFPRSTVDGYALRAGDTFGATESMPAYLKQIGEIPMGGEPGLEISPGHCALIHTGGMIPAGASAVVMLEHTQVAAEGEEIEVLKPVAEGENTIRVGEDVARGAVVLRKGQVLGPAEIGGLLGLGIMRLRVVERPRVALISSGDEVVEPSQATKKGQVRDINAFTLSSLILRAGGEPVRYGIVPDDRAKLREVAARSMQDCDAVIITAGSSASSRDMTAEVIDSLGSPGVLVHGINTRPGKPTILGACSGKAMVGLPGNPVSALVNGYLLVVPLIDKLTGREPRINTPVVAKLSINLASQAGREDWWPVRLIPEPQGGKPSGGSSYLAEPIFGKSNLIFSLAAADGLLRIPPDATGLGAGEAVEVYLI